MYNRDQKEQLVIKDHLEILAHLGPKDHRDKEALQATLENK